jgi:tetratricopeptide (TPR) repeat protein
MKRAIAAGETRMELMRSAQRALAQGDHTQLRAGCETIIKENPDDAGAHSLLGISYLQQNQIDKAYKHLTRSLKIFPADKDSLVALGQVHLRRDNAREAENCFEQASAFTKDDVEIMRLSALSIMQQGRFSDAIGMLDTLLSISPMDADAFNKRGFARQQTGDLIGAIGNFSRAILLQPQFVEAWNNRGNALWRQGRLEQALADFDKAISLRPGYAIAHAGKATTLLAMNQLDAARQSAQKSIELAPQNARCHSALGLILQKSGVYLESIESFDAALKIVPDLLEALMGSAYSQQQLGRIRESAQLYERTLKFTSDFPDAIWKKGELALLQAEFPEGWRLYESRLQSQAFRQASRLRGVSEWQGEDLTGKSICVHSEWDLGDTIQICRYLPKLANQAEKVIFVVPENLRPLMDGVDPRLLLVDRTMPLRNISYQCSLLSLPHRFATTLDTIPELASQLSVSNADSDKWQQQIKSEELNVGLCRNSDPGGDLDLTQSIAAEHLEILRESPGINFVSLEFPEGRHHRGSETARRGFYESGSNALDIESLSDCAALMKCLDLVVTVDGVIAHLAGTLGIPVWVMLKSVPNWRWMLDRDNSPWYPTMRLFRQKTFGEWTETVDQIDAELRRAQKDKPGRGQ